tara:strand:+ start:549 stop:1376 length:828 start_codon:yes stop_codon:yes gene_type:complete
VFRVGGDTDTSAFPEITAIAGNSFQGQTITTIGKSPITPNSSCNYPDKFSVITFTLTQASNVRIDLAWPETTGFAASAAGQSLTEVIKVVDFSLRDAAGAAMPHAFGATYFNKDTLVPELFYGQIPIPPTVTGGVTVYSASRKAQKAQAKLFTNLPPGSYTLTAYGRLVDGFFGCAGNTLYTKPNLQVGLITGAAASFPAYQSALVAPLGLGDAEVPNDPDAAWRVAPPPPPPPPPLRLSRFAPWRWTSPRVAWVSSLPRARCTTPRVRRCRDGR